VKKEMGPKKSPFLTNNYTLASHETLVFIID